MYIKKLRVYNYKSYFDSGDMEFMPGINIIVGKNNAGKTSLLEVLTLDFEDHPHRSIKTLPTSSSKITEESRVEISLLFEKEELVNLINELPHPIGLIFPDDYKEEYWDCLEPEDQVKLLVEWFHKVLDNPPIELNLSLHKKSQINGVNNIITKNYNFLKNDLLPKDKNGKFYFIQIKYSKNHKKFHPIFKYQIIDDPQYGYYEETSNAEEVESFEGNIEQTIGYQIFNIFKKRIYRFKAERLNIGICKFENLTNIELKSDASNLAEVLFRLNSENRGMFDYFTELVSSILPEIKSITIKLRDNSELEILVWNKDSIEHRRGDLALPLSSCGSGVSQVLAIVYILVSSIHEPRTIIIDEPQSFLHPGAAKKLIETIQQFPQHQYFIATHSPDIITTADPTNIIKLQYENCETTASVIDAKNIEKQKEILDELGVRLSDVFGADSILWVEGPTEEKCFPLIIDKFLAEMPLKGMKILCVKSTDALLDGKHSSLVTDIYNKLESGISLIPKKSIFIFDSEGKTSGKIDEFKRRGFKFLERPMYENYILNPDAISAIINEEAELKSPITSIQVQECFDKIQPNTTFLLKDITNDNWLFKVHGAKVIHSIFQELSETQLDFNGNKPKYCCKITKWLIKNQPYFLDKLAQELTEILREILNKDRY